MSFLELAKNRYSVRKFSNKKIEKEKIDKILQSGNIAPTGCNYQPQRILLLDNQTSLNKLKKCTKYHFDCPLALIVCYDKTDCWTRKWDGKQCGEVDATIVTTHIMLQAFELGIGSTWVMSFNPTAVKEEFNLPDNFIPVAIMPMGYPAKDCQINPLHNTKKDLSKTVFYNKF